MLQAIITIELLQTLLKYGPNPMVKKTEENIAFVKYLKRGDSKYNNLFLFSLILIYIGLKRTLLIKRNLFKQSKDLIS